MKKEEKKNGMFQMKFEVLWKGNEPAVAVKLISVVMAGLAVIAGSAALATVALLM